MVKKLYKLLIENPGSYLCEHQSLEYRNFFDSFSEGKYYLVFFLENQRLMVKSNKIGWMMGLQEQILGFWLQFLKWKLHDKWQTKQDIEFHAFVLGFYRKYFFFRKIFQLS